MEVIVEMFRLFFKSIWDMLCFAFIFSYVFSGMGFLFVIALYMEPPAGSYIVSHVLTVPIVCSWFYFGYDTAKRSLEKRKRHKS